jgi:hypothetical protein
MLGLIRANITMKLGLNDHQGPNDIMLKASQGSGEWSQHNATP